MCKVYWPTVYSPVPFLYRYILYFFWSLFFIRLQPNAISPLPGSGEGGGPRCSARRISREIDIEREAVTPSIDASVPQSYRLRPVRDERGGLKDAHILICRVKVANQIMHDLDFQNHQTLNWKTVFTRQ